MPVTDPRPTQQLAADVRAGAHFYMAHQGKESPHPQAPEITVWQHTINQEDCPGCKAEAALDALVARITDLEAQERALRGASVDALLALDALKEYEAQWHELNTPEFTEYWFTIGKTCSAGEAIKDLLAAKEAAEAQVAALTAEVQDERTGRHMAEDERERLRERVAALTQDNAVLRELPSREVVARAEAAEAALAEVTEERDRYATALGDGSVALTTTRQALTEIANLPDLRPGVNAYEGREIARRALAATEDVT